MVLGLWVCGHLWRTCSNFTMTKKAAHYDTYDYPSYWKGREYEHLSEALALDSLLKNSPVMDTIVDVGGGYGRLIPCYVNKANKVIFTEPSASLLEIAKREYKNNKKLSYLHSTLEDLPKSIKQNSVDAIVMVRVMHHLSDPTKVIETFSKLLKKNGILLLEFANKIHGKALLSNICRGDFGFSNDMAPTDRRCIENKSSETISFYNYHPKAITDALHSSKFSILAKRSVSNVRNQKLKKYISLNLLMQIEALLQVPFSFVYFGPSIFILAQKRG